VSDFLSVSSNVAAAVAAGRPVVALESTVIAHGLPRPLNLETARELERSVGATGAIPATIGIADGRLVVGLSEDEIQELAESANVLKVSRRGVVGAVVSGGLGATTVAATAWAASRAGIRLVATGGIGGVHRGGEASLDVSADLTELSKTRVAVVCSGAKSILDLPRTIEVLETEGVPVLGFGTNDFPAFYARESGLKLENRVDTPEDAACFLSAHWDLEMESGVIVAQPPPGGSALPSRDVERWIERALGEAATLGVSGKEVTPFLLARLAELSEGQTLETNRALLVANATLAARIATAWAQIK
jgi:pseudouridine-5'-phosphate glycosidase